MTITPKEPRVTNTRKVQPCGVLAFMFPIKYRQTAFNWLFFHDIYFDTLLYAFTFKFHNLCSLRTKIKIWINWSRLLTTNYLLWILSKHREIGVHSCEMTSFLG